MCDLTNPIFNDETAARKFLEAQRWPGGVVCPYCGEVGSSSPLKGKSMGPGWYNCRSCRKKFTVRVGTLYERSHVKLHKWLLATHLMCASKKGISAHQLHRMLGVTYKTAWFIAHRIRASMIDADPSPMGGSGKAVQADETYFGTQKNPEPSPQRKGRPYKSIKRAKRKRAVVGLVCEGQVRTFHVAKANAATVRGILFTNADRASELHTDESRLYTATGENYAKHRTVRHTAGEYVGKDGQTTNAIENYFSIFKRGMKGVYQHCGEPHLHRYLTEFDFRYNTRTMTDAERAVAALKGIEGKRLTYRRTNGRA